MDALDALPAVSLTELRYAVAVEEFRHFGRAAAACHVTQPTLSSGIKKLEGTLGVILFERTRRTVKPTAVGTLVALQARRVLEETFTLVRVAAQESRPLVGPLRIGIIPSLGPYALPWLLPLLERAFPELEPLPQEAITADLVEGLMAHRLDVALLALPLDEPRLRTLPIFEEPFYLLAPATHRLAKRKRVGERDLAGLKVLLLTEGHCLREQALSICDRAEAETRTHGADVRATSLETLRHLVAADMGATLVPALAVEPERPGAKTRAIPFQAPAPTRRIALAYRQTYPRPDDLKQLADEIRAALPAAVQALS